MDFHQPHLICICKWRLWSFLFCHDFLYLDRKMFNKKVKHLDKVRFRIQREENDTLNSFRIYTKGISLLMKIRIKLLEHILVMNSISRSDYWVILRSLCRPGIINLPWKHTQFNLSDVWRYVFKRKIIKVFNSDIKSYKFIS